METLKLQFDESKREIIKERWIQWWEHDLERPVVVIEIQNGLTNFNDYITRFPMEDPVEKIIDYFTERLNAIRYLGDAWPTWWPNFGPGIVSAFLGAHVHAKPDTVWFEPDPQQTIEGLSIQLNERNIWWNRVADVTRAAVERWGDQVIVGHTDLGGNLDILGGLVQTETIMIDMMLQPDVLRGKLEEINDVWLDTYQRLLNVIPVDKQGTRPWAHVWSPKNCYILQSDLAYMISPDMFEKFVLPDVAACCDYLDHTVFHLDGKGMIPHLDMLLSLENLHAVQWIPGEGAPPVEEWPEVIDKILKAGKGCQLYVSAKGAKKLVKQFGKKGFAFFIRDHLEKNEAQALYKELTE